MTSHWNFRVVREQVREDEQYTIREVYYDGEVIVGWSHAISPSGESVADLRTEMGLWMEAFKKPVLEVKAGQLREVGEKHEEEQA